MGSQFLRWRMHTAPSTIEPPRHAYAQQWIALSISSDAAYYLLLWIA